MDKISDSERAALIKFHAEILLKYPSPQGALTAVESLFRLAILMKEEVKAKYRLDGYTDEWIESKMKEFGL